MKRKIQLDIPGKANLILNVVLVAFIFIVIRIWHLTVVQHDDKLESSRKPQRRTIIEPAKRGTIRDRFNIPLALNKLQYNASILYGQIQQIPQIVWEIKDGKRVKKYKRREYIEQFAQMLGKELQLDAERVEDLIYSRASFYSNIPFIIKEELSELEYYRLKMLEKEWLGLQMQIVPKRHYPQGRVGSDIIGFLGMISREKYEGLVQEIKALEEYLSGVEFDLGEGIILPEGIKTPAEARKRLKQLQEAAYSISDYVGKSGIEAKFEEVLRGFHGKKSYASDARGSFVRALPGSRSPVSGQRILLSISSELQEYAEKLLIQNDQARTTRAALSDYRGTMSLPANKPWMKGGAIVVMDPNNGEILALASYPRFDPNDFIGTANSKVSLKKRSNIQRWFETENYIGEIWDQKRPYEREKYNVKLEDIYEESHNLNWKSYLDTVLYSSSAVREAIDEIGTIKNAVAIQRTIENLILTEKSPNLTQLFRKKDPLIENSLPHCLRMIDQYEDRTLLIDLCRLAVPAERFDDKLLTILGNQTIGEYRDITSAMATVQDEVRKMCRDLFHEIEFKKWRKENQKSFLKKKREEEKIAGRRYPKPYLDLLDAFEKEQFETFWSEWRWPLIYAFVTGKVPAINSVLLPYFDHFIWWNEELVKGAHPEVSWRPAYTRLQNAVQGLSPEIVISYFSTMRGFHELNRPLFGNYRILAKPSDGILLEKHLAQAFYPKHGFGYARSYAYRQAASQGSIFKVVSAYSILMDRYKKLNKEFPTHYQLNPMEIVDDVILAGNQTYYGYGPDGKLIPQVYKGGRVMRSSRKGIGKIDIMGALENSSNPYFCMSVRDFLDNPETLANNAKLFSYGEKTGIDLTGEFAGRVPDDLATNLNGLYATAIGQHTLVVTPLQTATMLSAISNGGKVLKPKVVKMLVGTPRDDSDQQVPMHFPYQDHLNLAGVDFPLFISSSQYDQKKLIHNFPTIVQRELFMPKAVHQMLLEGMRRAVSRIHATNISGLSNIYKNYPEAMSDLLDLKGQFVGKSSTAEARETLFLDQQSGAGMYHHVWFGAISYDRETSSFLARDGGGKPELVVIIYLKYGDWGKDGSPMAAQIIQKWREINRKG